MSRFLNTICLLALALPLPAAELQGYLADWNCVDKIVKNGAEKVFKDDKSCSLQPRYKRSAYGLITDGKKFYRLDAAGNKHALELLQNSSVRDNLHVIVKGDITGNMIKVTDMSIL